MAGILWTLVVLLAAFWVLGLVAHVGGSLVHLLIVGAIVLAVLNLILGRPARSV